MTDKAKWLQKETLRIHEEMDKKTDAFMSRIDRSYQQVYDTLEREVKTLKGKLDRGQITSDFMELRTNVLISQLENRVRELNLEFAKELETKMKNYDEYSREGMKKILDKLITVDLPRYSLEFGSGFAYENYTFQSSINKAGITIGTKLNEVLAEGLAKGWDDRKYKKEIQAIGKFTKFEANRIGRTELARASTEGSRRSMKEYGVERVEWESALERRTCPICASLNGKKFPIDQAPPLPRHPFCRCVLQPVIDKKQINFIEGHLVDFMKGENIKCQNKHK